MREHRPLAWWRGSPFADDSVDVKTPYSIITTLSRYSHEFDCTDWLSLGSAFIFIRIAEDLMTQEELVLPGEFIGAILFTIVLPLVAVIAVAVNYLRHVG